MESRLSSPFFLFNVPALVLLLLVASTGILAKGHRKSSTSSQLDKFDEVMEMLMHHGNVPGAQLAVAKDGHLKYFKAFGVANLHTGELLTTNHVLRYNSISKVFTGVAILNLIQEGRLSLDDKAMHYVEDLAPPKGASVDPRVRNITIQHLLQHTAGWNETLPAQNVFILPGALFVSQSLGSPVPPTTYDAIRYIKGVSLDFNPGSAMEYSSLGYQILGRVVEKVTGMKYTDYMRRHVFTPLGLASISPAQSQVQNLAHNEVRYYGLNGMDKRVLSIFPGEGYVNGSYGNADYSMVDSSAGWKGNAKDAVRFMDHIDGLRPPAILSPEMVQIMLNTPLPAKSEYFKRGLNVFVSVDKDGKVDSFQHGGSNYGAMSMVMRLVPTNITFAFELNTCLVGDWVFNAIGNLTEVASAVKDWPRGDLTTE